MKPLKNFDEFLKQGIVSARTPDRARARSLAEESEKRKRFLTQMLDKIGLSDENANYFIENSYDLLIELIRAKLLTDGFSSSGTGSHEAEVSYLARLSFAEKDIRFMNELRYHRNGILYYGKDFDAEYAKKVIEFLENIYPKLKRFAE